MHLAVVEATFDPNSTMILPQAVHGAVTSLYDFLHFHVEKRVVTIYARPRYPVIVPFVILSSNHKLTESLKSGEDMDNGIVPAQVLGILFSEILQHID